MKAGQVIARDVLRDGLSVHIRAISPAKQARLAAFHGRLSPESVYFRFFENKGQLTPADLRY